MGHQQRRRDLDACFGELSSLVAAQLRRDQIHLSGKLWSLSHDGCCLHTHSDGPVPATQEDALLRISDPTGANDLELCVRVQWVERDEGSRFVGLQFHEPVDWRPTFLAALLPASGAPQPS